MIFLKINVWSIDAGEIVIRLRHGCEIITAYAVCRNAVIFFYGYGVLNNFSIYHNADALFMSPKI